MKFYLADGDSKVTVYALSLCYLRHFRFPKCLPVYSNTNKMQQSSLFHSPLANLLGMCYCKINSRRYSHCKNIINSRSGAFARIYQEDMAKENEKKVDNF